MYLSRLQLSSLFSKQRLVQHYAAQSSKCRRHIHSTTSLQLNQCVIECRQLKPIRAHQKLLTNFPPVTSQSLNSFSTSSFRLKDDKGKETDDAVPEKSQTKVSLFSQ